MNASCTYGSARTTAATLRLRELRSGIRTEPTAATWARSNPQTCWTGREQAAARTAHNTSGSMRSSTAHTFCRTRILGGTPSPRSRPDPSGRRLPTHPSRMHAIAVVSTTHSSTSMLSPVSSILLGHIWVSSSSSNGWTGSAARSTTSLVCSRIQRRRSSVVRPLSTATTTAARVTRFLYDRLEPTTRSSRPLRDRTLWNTWLCATASKTSFSLPGAARSARRTSRVS